MQTPEELTSEFLGYVEQKSAATLAVVSQAYDDLHARASNLATLLAGGAGAVGAMALDRLGAVDARLISWVPLALLSITWFGIAGFAALRGLSSRTVSAGNGMKNIGRYYEDCVASHGIDKALEMTRREELRKGQERISGYIDACNARAGTLDAAYRMIVLSPVVPAVAAALCYWRGGA